MKNKEKILDDRLVLVTGAAGNLGKVFCNSIVKNGGRVFITDLNKREVNNLVNEINADFPEHAFGSVLDITSNQSLENCIAKIKNIGITPNALINNALPFNSSYGNLVEDISMEDFNENISFHVGGYFNVTNQMIRHFFQKGDVSIINISSIYGFVTPDFDLYKDESFTMPIEYAIAKSSIIQLTKYYSSYYKNKSIRFNSVSPGGIERNHSNGFKQKYKNKCLNKGLLNEADIVGTIIFLLSKDSSFIKGQNIVIDDGFSL